MDSAAVVADVLASPAGRAAVEQQNVAALIRMARQALGWRQADLAKAADYSQPTISRLEKGQGRIDDIAVRTRIAEVLGLPPTSIGLIAKETTQADERTVSNMRRAELLRGLVGAAAALALPREVSAPERACISDRVVSDCRAALDRLYEMDEQRGGATVYTLASQMVGQLRDTLARGTYKPSIGRDLRGVAALTAEHAGWLAFDAGQLDNARHWWLEALHLADLAESYEIRTTALTSMALQACYTPNPADGREAVDLIDAANKAAVRGKSSRRLQSLLTARQAFGHARTGDTAKAASLLAESDRLLDGNETADHDPTWLEFWGPADLACHKARSFISTNQLGPAISAARSAVALCDRDKYPRNHAIYSTVLATALARGGQIDEAIAASTTTVARASTFGSRRVTAEAHRIVDLVDKRRGYMPADDFVAWARQLLPAA